MIIGRASYFLAGENSMSKFRKGEKAAKLGKTYMILKPFCDEKLPVQTILYI